jgi:DNA-binding transcriptional LysR family regulator
MDLRQMNYFLVLAEELHFGRAAERLNISQPPLSRSIQQLEADLGVILFERTKRSVHLSHAGKELLHDARQLVLQMQNAKKRLSDFGKGLSGVLRVGYVGASMHTDIVNQLAKFANENPKIQFTFEENPNNNLLFGLNNNTLDLAIIRTELMAENIQSYKLSEDPLVLVLPKNHTLAQHETVKLSAVKNENFIAFARECGPTIFDRIVNMCTQEGFSPNILHHASQFNSVLRLVESGFGVAVVPQSATYGYNLGIKCVELKNAHDPIPLYLLTKKDSNNKTLDKLRNYLLASYKTAK